MPLELLNTYRAETGAWYALVRNDDGRTAEVKFRTKPTKTEALAAVNAVFNPPKSRVVAEDGTALDLEDADVLTINLTPAQKTRLLADIADLQLLVNMVAGKLPRGAALAQLREHSPILDGLLSIAERLR